MEPEDTHEESHRSSTGLEEPLAGVLCYLFGWVSGLVFLVIEQRSGFVRFHAWQSTVTFLGLTALGILANWIPLVGGLIRVVLPPVSFVVWVLLMYRAWQGERFRLPLIGEYAEEQAGMLEDD